MLNLLKTKWGGPASKLQAANDYVQQEQFEKAAACYKKLASEMYPQFIVAFGLAIIDNDENLLRASYYLCKLAAKTADFNICANVFLDEYFQVTNQKISILPKEQEHKELKRLASWTKSRSSKAGDFFDILSLAYRARLTGKQQEAKERYLLLGAPLKNEVLREALKQYGRSDNQILPEGDEKKAICEAARCLSIYAGVKPNPTERSTFSQGASYGSTN